MLKLRNLNNVIVLYTGSDTLIGTHVQTFQGTNTVFVFKNILQIIKPDEEKLEIHLTIPAFVLATQKELYAFCCDEFLSMEEPTDELIAAYNEIIEKRKKESD